CSLLYLSRQFCCPGDSSGSAARTTVRLSPVSKKGTDMKHIIRWIASPVLAGVMVLTSQSPAQAQNMNFSAGYQFGHVSQNGFSETLPYGWNVDVSGVFRPIWAGVGEGGGVYKSENAF